jgi:hypothetical protein
MGMLGRPDLTNMVPYELRRSEECASEGTVEVASGLRW